MSNAPLRGEGIVGVATRGLASDGDGSSSDDNETTGSLPAALVSPNRHHELAEVEESRVRACTANAVARPIAIAAKSLVLISISLLIQTVRTVREHLLGDPRKTVSSY